MTVEPHPLTHNPTAAWSDLSKTQKVFKIKYKPPVSDVPSNKVRTTLNSVDLAPINHAYLPSVRIVCMSDTHSLTPHLKFAIPDGDIFIHAGDFTRCGSLEDVLEFNEWIGRLPHKHKIVIAGNHELSFDDTFTSTHKDDGKSAAQQIPTLGFARNAITEAAAIVNVQQYLTNCTYLQDDSIVLYGLKIYGTPWQPVHHNWAFNVPRGAPCLSKWDEIPSDTDILVTHTPPIGHGDLCCTGVRAGCVELLACVQQRVQPKYHVFGHIHEGYGITSDGKIIYINASTCDINYSPTNLPVVFDIGLPPGQEKV